ncbi:hypothetical protein F5B22DRAFT_648744 [Xylaria bambusicola]|uniref:uncharacterized protein n=1 Tax=Xylaria bambusicola TaxID=326684 RepID=UPI0020084768|nr:uncharacterized protein F5B22DRAFT_648744 [Xylaria bambusicola]KAI0509723.1 hypothetical protein F5B22DRAFT_648744 [Xylaria bambusicola]
MRLKQFKYPRIASACQDMRQYAMDRYRIICVNYSIYPKRDPPLWPKKDVSQLGFFDPRRDSLSFPIHYPIPSGLHVPVYAVTGPSRVKQYRPVAKEQCIDLEIEVIWAPESEARLKVLFGFMTKNEKDEFIYMEERGE